MNIADMIEFERERDFVELVHDFSKWELFHRYEEKEDGHES